MENIVLSHSGVKKLNQDIRELFYQDIDTNIKSFTPGQWCYFEDARKKKFYLGFINPFVDNNRPCARIISAGTNTLSSIDEEKVLASYLDKAIAKRKLFFGSLKNTRLVYGGGDDLPGLIVDAFEKVIIIQINTAGIDRHRDFIERYFNSLGEFNVCFLDSKEYRKGEMLPEFEARELPEVLEIKENLIRYEIRAEVMQKIGFYFDHRLNRDSAAKIAAKYSPNAKCLDLFCYVGAWGFNLLREGASHVDFVDQGNFDQELGKNLELNSFQEKGNFHKGDVFSFLKNYSGEKYDVICSDPPAFCKSKREAHRAKEGYLKLHGLCLNNLKRGGIFIACSCTHYVDHDEFQATVTEAAKRVGKDIQLIDVGMQSLDHPIKSLNQKNSYLKYYAYYVE